MTRDLASLASATVKRCSRFKYLDFGIPIACSGVQATVALGVLYDSGGKQLAGTLQSDR